MSTATLPPPEEMFAAFERRDRSYEGLFLTAVKTTGIFCRPGCPAKTPRRENVEFFPTPSEALLAGYRPCKRCRPLEPSGQAPDWLRPLLERVEQDPTRRWRERDLRALGLDPARVRRWFQASHGMSFHAYQRARRLGLALGRLRDGEDVTGSGLAAGFDSESGFREAFERLFGRKPAAGRQATPVTVGRLTTPLGALVVGATDGGVCLAEFCDRRGLENQIKRLVVRLDALVAPGRHPLLERLERELGEYFAGRRREFDVPLLAPGTEFQSAVWAELRRIPYGETRSYEQLAREIGRPTARRAVGRANGDNRLAILIPCHRVVRADGSLCGYGGGLWRKRHLLDLEGAAVAQR